MDREKTGKQPLAELTTLRQRVAELEFAEAECREAETRFQQQNKFLNNVLESLTHPFYVVNIDDYTVEMANSAARLDGLSGDTTCYALAHRQSQPCSTANHPCPVEEIKSTRKPTTVEHVHYDADDQPCYVQVHGYPLFDDEGNVAQIIEYSFDVTDHRRAEEEFKLDEARLNSLLEISQKAHELSELDIVQMAIEEAVTLTGSAVGYLHFVNPDERTLQLVTWSEKTEEQCAATYVSHYPVDQAGVWADCVRWKKPVVHNDYQNLADKKGYPQGHTHITRHTSVPVLDEGRVVMILGVGNKQTNYGETDVRQLLLIGNQIVRILRRKRAEEALRQRMEELSVLHAIALAGSKATSLDELVGLAIEVIGKTLYSDHFGVGIVDEETGVLRVHPSSTDVRGRLAPFTIPLGQGVSGRVIATGEPWRVPDVTRETAYRAAIPGMRSELCVPLRVGKRVIGVLNAESSQPDAFSEADERLMTTFAIQLATTIEKVRLFEAERQRAREAETLRQAGAAVVATLRQDEAIERILQELAQVVPHDSAVVQVLREGYVENVGGRGWPNSKAPVGLRFPVPGDNPNAVVIQQRRPVILADALVYTSFQEEPHMRIRSWLGVPLIFRDRVIGMLALDSERPNHFTPDHARLVAAFADQVAVAMENARLFEEVQQLAMVDPLTGLFNRRHFFTVARREFERARRYGRFLSVLMLDIDHFKQVNDTYGHAAGDHVLRVIAQRCQRSLRDIDVVGRYGGEEFVVLLPETDLASAQLVAEKLHRGIAAAIHTEKAAITITVSLGAGALDEGCANLEVLLERADQALYAAKQAGRNCVRAWQCRGNSI